uniref:Uncharacterized protein n=1 Tax=Panagrellus redivivus TaxID=6233 RepID=A0A7E4VG38_PANRE
MTKDNPPKPPETPPGLSELELAHLRARFHAAQFRYTSALAADSGRANDGVFRIQTKPENLKNVTKKPLGEQWEVIESMHGPHAEDNCPIEVIEPEFDFKTTGSDSGSSEDEDDAELAPNEIEEFLDHDHRAWLDEILEADPDVSVAMKKEISKRKTERGLHKTVREKKKEKAKEAINAANYSCEKLVPVPALNTGLPDLPPDSNLGNDQPLVPVYVGSQELLMPGEKMQEEHDLSSDARTTSADPLFDCVEQDLVLDDQYLMEIAHGLKEGVTYDDTYVTDDLKKKLLDIENNKDKVDSQIAAKASAAPVKTDETAQKIVQALTNQDVIAKTVDVEDSKVLKEYFSGGKKVDESVLNALNRVIDRILDRAPEFYDNKEELAVFMRNRATAKMHLLDAMLAMKGGWLSNLYGSAYNTALAVVAGVNATVEAVNKGVTVAKVQAEYAKKIAEQTTTAAKELMNSEAVKNAQAQAIKFGSMAATMAGAVASTVSTATSALSTSASSTDTTASSVSTVSTVKNADGTTTTTETTTAPSTGATASVSTTLPATDSTTSASNEAEQAPDVIAPDAVTTDGPPATPAPSSTNESKSIEEVDPAGQKVTNKATSPAVLTLNGFLHAGQSSPIVSPVPRASLPAPAPVPSAAIDGTGTEPAPGGGEQEPVYYTMWSALCWVLSMPYGMDSRSFADSPINAETPPAEAPKDKDKDPSKKP